MVDTSKLSKFLRAESVTDGDTIKFVDGGVILEREFKDNKTGEVQNKEVLEITVDYNGDHKTYSPNGTTIKILNKAWGTDTDQWVGKTARINILPAPNGKDMIIAKPVGSKVVNPEDLEFKN